MEITFLNPEYLWLLLAIPTLIIIHFYSLKYVHNRAIKFANFEALERVTGGIVLSRNIYLLMIRLMSILFLTLSLAGATMWYFGQSDVSDYVLAIDNSGSMLANDFTPNRLEAAKEASIKFVEKLEGDSKVAVVSFSGAGFVELPLTKSKSKVIQSIQDIQISNVHGTAIGDALKTSANIISLSDKSRSVILLTDGQENIALESEVKKVIDFVASKQIVVNTIGVATLGGGSLPGLNSISTLDDELLMNIARLTKGSYIQSETNDELIEAYNSFTYESTETNIPIYLRLPLIIIAILILFIEWILVNTKYRTIP
jgi:Ca-activated chloride channel homolog